MNRWPPGLPGVFQGSSEAGIGALRAPGWMSAFAVVLSPGWTSGPLVMVTLRGRPLPGVFLQALLVMVALAVSPLPRGAWAGCGVPFGNPSPGRHSLDRVVASTSTIPARSDTLWFGIRPPHKVSSHPVVWIMDHSGNGAEHDTQLGCLPPPAGASGSDVIWVALFLVFVHAVVAEFSGVPSAWTAWCC